MTYIKVVTGYWTCDRCKASGNGEEREGLCRLIPLDWCYLTVAKAHNKAGEANPSELRALLCPKCKDAIIRFANGLDIK
jgi:hypothetical protein